MEKFVSIDKNVETILVVKKSKFIANMIKVDSVQMANNKLKEIKKPEYKEQIKGYKEYLQTKTKKPVKAYLYSILEEKYLEC